MHGLPGGMLEQTIAPLLVTLFHRGGLSSWGILQKILLRGLTSLTAQRWIVCSHFPEFLFLSLQNLVWLHVPWLHQAPPSRHLSDLFIISVYRPWLLNPLPKITQWMKTNAMVLELCWLSIGAIVWAQYIECFPCHWTMKAASPWLQWKASIWGLMADFWGLFFTRGKILDPFKG